MAPAAFRGPGAIFVLRPAMALPIDALRQFVSSMRRGVRLASMLRQQLTPKGALP